MTLQQIQSIDKKTVLKICSGQSVINLSTAVKELVENSLDASSTNIEIKLKEYGIDCIEVSDNGSGIEPSNYEGLVLKHYTSKIRDFNDLNSISSFGFRGEALSSICELSSKLIVLTRIASQTTGYLLEFNSQGKLVKQTKAARSVGTTVTCYDLFSQLPVRRKEFEKNIKKHYSNLLRILQGYAIISSSTRISCVNILRKNSVKQQVINTQPNKNLLESIATVFGSKFSKTLINLEINLDDDKKEEIKDSSGSSSRRIFGVISSAGNGVGRCDNDRQFMYVNGRPVNIPKVTKAINEVWRQYEMKHKPAFAINFLLPQESVDVNVTPDKRSVYLANEENILINLRSGLHKIWEKSGSTFHISQEFELPSKPEILSQSQSQSIIQHEQDESVCSDPRSQEFSSENNCEVSNEKVRKETENALTTRETTSRSSLSNQIEVKKRKRLRIPNSSKQMFSQFLRQEKSDIEDPEDTCILSTAESLSLNSTSRQKIHLTENVLRDEKHLTKQLIFDKLDSKDSTDDIEQYNDIIDKEIDETSDLETEANLSLKINESLSDFEDNEFIISFSNDNSPNSKKAKISIEDSETETDKAQSNDSQETVLINDDQELEIPKNTVMTLKGDIIKMKADRNILKNNLLPSKDSILPCSLPIVCSANIEEIDNTPELAAREFERVLEKQSFNNMQILGQFNLGFILARLGNDLFIIDQHASDEKFNFENIQKTTILHEQRLLTPRSIDLTAVEEITIMDHLEIFRSNGFHFLVDENAPATKRLKLVALPFSKNTQFGLDDIHELSSLLIDNPGKMVRLPKATSMFASRACRMSIMIGTALSHEQMKKIVKRLADLEQPWNCPHGRPTMRHLLDLSSLSKRLK